MVRSASSRVSNHEVRGHPSRRAQVRAPQSLAEKAASIFKPFLTA
jgi:hypothetical protein